MNKVPVGPSTIAMLGAALAAAVAFVAEWSQSGTAPAWLGGIAAALTALTGLFRSWQSVSLTKAEAPVVMETLPADWENEEG